MKGWRKLASFALLVLLAAFAGLKITWEIVALFGLLCGANITEWIKTK